MKRIFLLLLLVFSLLFTQLGCTDTIEKELPSFVLENTSYSYESENNLPISSYHPYDSDYLNTLREKYMLDDLTKSAETEFDQVQAIVLWVTNLWPHDGWNEPQKSDALYILDEVTENGQKFRCVEYATVIHGCLSALDIPVRILGLKTSDVETRESGAGHVGCEVYLKDLNKWIFVDGQWGVIPTLDDIPLNGVEFAQALDEYFQADKDGEKHNRNLSLINLQSPYNTSDYYEWIHDYLFYFDFGYWRQNSNRYISRSVHTNIMLVPISAKEPTIFQIHYPMDIDIYTNSVVDFYPSIW